MSQLRISTNPETGLSAYIDEANGEAFLTKKLTTNLLGLHNTTLDRIIAQSDRVQLFDLKGTQILTNGGLQEVQFLIKATDLKHIIKAVLNGKTKNKSKALVVQDKLIDAGATAFVYNLCGYSMQPQQPRFSLPQTYVEALECLLDTTKKKEALEAKIKEDEPKVALAEAISFSDTSVSFNEYAKLINTGRTRMFRQMRECGVVMKSSTLPYQNWIDAGYFEVSQEILGDGRLIPFALVTGKGQLWLKQRLDAHIALQKKVIGGIAQGVLDMSI